jgi:hypothetical protein
LGEIHILQLDRRAFSFFDVKKHAWIAEPGEFAILVGARLQKQNCRENTF